MPRPVPGATVVRSTDSVLWMCSRTTPRARWRSSQRIRNVSEILVPREHPQTLRLRRSRFQPRDGGGVADRAGLWPWPLEQPRSHPRTPAVVGCVMQEPMRREHMHARFLVWFVWFPCSFLAVATRVAWVMSANRSLPGPDQLEDAPRIFTLPSALRLECRRDQSP